MTERLPTSLCPACCSTEPRCITTLCKNGAFLISLLKALQKLAVESWAADKCDLNSFIINPYISSVFPGVIPIGLRKKTNFWSYHAFRFSIQPLDSKVPAVQVSKWNGCFFLWKQGRENFSRMSWDFSVLLATAYRAEARLCNQVCPYVHLYVLSTFETCWTISVKFDR